MATSLSLPGNDLLPGSGNDSGNDLLPASEVYELSLFDFVELPWRTSCADLPKGFAVVTISIGETSTMVLTELGKVVMRSMLCGLLHCIDLGKEFDKLEPRDLVYSMCQFSFEFDGIPVSRWWYNLPEDKRNMKVDVDKLLSAAKNFVESLCGGSSRIPPDLQHLLSVARSLIIDKSIRRNLLSEHSSLQDLDFYAWMMWNLGYFLGLSNMHEDDSDVEKMLATLDPSCYPKPWIDHVKMVAGSDTQYDFLVKVLKVCERRSCRVLGAQKGSEVFSGVKGIAIFFRGLVGHALGHETLKAERGAKLLDSLLDIMDEKKYRQAFYRVYKAVNIIFPTFLGNIWMASRRSPALRDRVVAASTGYYF